MPFVEIRKRWVNTHFCGDRKFVNMNVQWKGSWPGEPLTAQIYHSTLRSKDFNVTITTTFLLNLFGWFSQRKYVSIYKRLQLPANGYLKHSYLNNYLRKKVDKRIDFTTFHLHHHQDVFTSHLVGVFSGAITYRRWDVFFFLFLLDCKMFSNMVSSILVFKKGLLKAVIIEFLFSLVPSQLSMKFCRKSPHNNDFNAKFWG